VSISGFDLRGKVKRQLNVWIDQAIEWVDTPEDDVAPGEPPKSPPTASPAPSNVSLSGLNPTPELEPLPELPNRPPSRSSGTTPTEQAAAKQKAHWETTRNGVLQFVVDQGNTANLRQMHDHSEQRYFVAHVSFSRLMEELVDEDLLAYNHDTAEATITDKGLAQLA